MNDPQTEGQDARAESIPVSARVVSSGEMRPAS